MQIKGATTSTIPKYVKEKYPAYFDRWIESLPPASKKIMANPIIITSWYEVEDAMVIPTRKLGELLFNSEQEAAWQLGRFSSEILLKGIYKIFIRVSSPLFVLSRVSNVLGSHYQPAKVQIIDKGDNFAVMEFQSFKPATSLALHRIAGWIEKTIETCGFSKIDIEIKNTGQPGAPAYTIQVEWAKG